MELYPSPIIEISMTSVNNTRNVNLASIRNKKKDVYENVVIECESSSSSDSTTSSIRKNKRCKKEKRCKKDKRCKTICDNICLVPPKNACEKKHVTHKFKISLGECKVVRDVNITHYVEANLEHLIKENITCVHEPCTKQTCEEINKIKDGKRCNVDFPECEDEISFVHEGKEKHHKKHHRKHQDRDDLHSRDVDSSECYESQAHEHLDHRDQRDHRNHREHRDQREHREHREHRTCQDEHRHNEIHDCRQGRTHHQIFI